MSKKTRYLIRIIGVLLLVVGLGGFLAAPISFESDFFREVLGSFELPLGELRGIAVDSEGHIYCGLQSYGRVQVYDAEGEFLYSVPSGSSGGAFKIRINENDQLEVATARNDKLYLFDKGGNLVREWSEVGHYFSDFGTTGETQFYDDKEDATYVRKGYPIRAYIVKRDSAGQENIIIRTPFHKWVFQSPLPAWFIGAIGGVMLWMSGDLKRQRRRGD
jgi:hypothetical protein